MPLAVDPMPMPTLVEIVNEWGNVPRHVADQVDRRYPPPGSLAGRTGVATPATMPGRRALIALADRLHPVFATHDAAVRIALVNQLLTASGVRPVLAAGPAGTRESWLVDNPAAALLAAAAIALREQLAGQRADRLGVCAGSGCADVFVDASPGAHRRFCSLGCQNRTRVAAFRGRHATAS